MISACSVTGVDLWAGSGRAAASGGGAPLLNEGAECLKRYKHTCFPRFSVAYLLSSIFWCGSAHADAEGALWTLAHADATGSKARARGAAVRACAVAKTGPTRPTDVTRLSGFKGRLTCVWLVRLCILLQEVLILRRGFRAKLCEHAGTYLACCSSYISPGTWPRSAREGGCHALRPRCRQPQRQRAERSLRCWPHKQHV